MAPTTQCERLTVEYLADPLGIDEPRPRFAWRVASDRPGARQTAYHLQVEGAWDAGEVASAATTQIAYEGAPLAPRTRYDWRVRSQDETGRWSDWSAAWFETGRMTTDAGSPWLRPPHGADPLEPARCLRRSFALDAPVRRARLYMAALGLYLPRVNGRAVTDSLFMPGWTDYYQRIQYQAYDVTDALAPGENVLAAVLNEGWYAGRIARHYSGGKPTYGERPALWCELDVTLDDGRRVLIVPDDAWRWSADGPWRMADIYNGVDYDARLEQNGWDAPGFDDRAWAPAPLDAVATPLVWNAAPPVRRTRRLDPVSVRPRADGTILVDFGQNFAGRERFTLAGLRAGQRIAVRHGEMLWDNGSLYTGNLRTARATTIYVARGGGEETFEPEFTWYGFRYCEFRGLDGPEQIQELAAFVLHSDLEETGEFSCSDERLNRLFHNVQWSQRSNFLDIPSDCPQRDERYGWSGDANVFCETAAFNMEVPAFYAKWLEDLSLCRNAAGAYPHYAPYYMPKDPDTSGWDTIIGAPGWADAGVICPWLLYVRYGDRRLLERHYDAMKGWIDFQCATSDGYIRSTPRYGDWLNLHADMPPDFVATAYFAWSAALVARVAGVLGRDDDQRKLADIAENVRRAFEEKFIPYGTLIYKTQCACAMILAFDLARPEYRDGILAILVEDIEVLRGGHMSTGFLGTPLLLRVLADHGRADVAYRLLTQTSYPGWLYPVLQGATTIWERLNSYTREGGFGDESMNSFNHYSYGSVAAWLYEGVAGLRPDPAAPGYARFRLAPLPGGGLDHARMRYAAPPGVIECAWEIAHGQIRFDVRVPPNSRCVFVPPAAEPREEEWGPGRHRFTMPLADLRADLAKTLERPAEAPAPVPRPALA